MTTGVTQTRIRLFNIGANRGPGDEVAIVYDAKNIGSEVMANDEGSAYWTLPINHALINEFQPLLRHYKIERLNTDTSPYTYDLVGAGLLTGADVTNDEVVFSGSDYMSVLNTYYTEVLGASTAATSPLEYVTGGITAVQGTYTYDSATNGVARSASFLTLGTSHNTTTYDWNNNGRTSPVSASEDHLPTGTDTYSQSMTGVAGGTSSFELQFSSATNILGPGNTVKVSGYVGTASSIINGTHTILTSTSSTITIGTSGAVGASLTGGGTVTAMRYTHRSLLRFDLTTNPDWSSLSRIKKATLKLYGSSTTNHVSPSSTTSRDLEVRRATVDWYTGDTSSVGTENVYGNSANANSDAGTMFSAYAGTAVTKAFTGVTNNALYEFDVTTFVTDWKSGAATNYGFHMKNSGELVSSRGITFFSTGYTTTAYRPKLYIEYETDTSASAAYDIDGLFKATTETKTYVSTPRISGRQPLLSKNSPTSALVDRTPIAMYFLDKSTGPFTASAAYWPTSSFFPSNAELVANYNTTNPPTDTNMNRFVVKYDEENEKYIITGILRIERSKQNSTTNRWSDYINSTSIYADFTVNDVVLSFAASPGGELFSVYLWKKNNTADGYAALSTNPHRSLEIPFWVEVFPATNQAIIKVDPPTAPAIDTPLNVDHTLSSVVVGGLTRYIPPTTAQYKVPILLTGQAYEFQVMATASITDTGGNHELQTTWINAYNQDKSPMSLRSETLQNITTRFLTTADKGAFDQPAVGATEVGRLNWATVENVNASGWPTEKLRYFTTGENITDFLRNIGDKQMSENAEIDLEGVQVPGRMVFNFVGVRRSDGSAANGSKLYINPNMTDQPALTLEYPGVIGAFRYNADGRRLRNDVRLIPSTAYLSGAYTNMSGVRLKGVTDKDLTSQQVYGLAPILTAQQGFIDESDATKAASRVLEQRKDFDVASTLTIQLERDKLNPFKDFFLGDAVRVFVRRNNINLTNSLYLDLLAGIYIIAGVTYKVGTDGAEDVVLQLLNSKYFAAVAG